MMSAAQAGRYFKDVPRREMVEVASGASTADIMHLVMEVCDDDALVGGVSAFIDKFRSRSPEFEYELVKELWRFCRRHIRYREDGWEEQKVKEPVRTWHDKQADCKSMAVFMYFCLRALGIPSFIRFASYWDANAVKAMAARGINVKKGQIGHVYNVAIINGRAVPVDITLGTFDAEAMAVRITDRFPQVWDRTDARSVSRHSMGAAIGRSETQAGPPTVVLASLAVLGIAGAVGGKGLARVASLAVGGWYARQTYLRLKAA